MPFPINRLPVTFLLEVLCKMENTELNKLRLTCSEIRNFIENHSRPLSARAIDHECDNYGLHVDFILASDGKVHILYNNTRYSRLTNAYNLRKYFSGISIVYVRFLNETKNLDDKMFQKFADRLKEADLCCGRAYFYHFPAKYIVQITRMMRCHGKFHVKGSKEPKENVVDILNSSSQRDRFDVSGFMPNACMESKEDEIRRFHFIKDRDSFTQNCSVKAFSSILQTMMDAGRDMGKISTIWSKFNFLIPDDFSIPNMPPHIVLWDISKLAKNDRARCAGSFAKKCRLFRTKTKWVLNVEEHNYELLRFLESPRQVMEYLATALKIWKTNPNFWVIVYSWSSIFEEKGDLTQTVIDDVLKTLEPPVAVAVQPVRVQKPSIRPLAVKRKQPAKQKKPVKQKKPAKPKKSAKLKKPAVKLRRSTRPRKPVDRLTYY